MINKYSKKVSELVLTAVRKNLCIDISSAVIFHGRELNLVSKCRQINKLSCGKKYMGISLEKIASAPLALTSSEKRKIFNQYLYFS